MISIMMPVQIGNYRVVQPLSGTVVQEEHERTRRIDHVQEETRTPENHHPSSSTRTAYLVPIYRLGPTTRRVKRLFFLSYRCELYVGKHTLLSKASWLIFF
jgi:hypothetical protein